MVTVRRFMVPRVAHCGEVGAHKRPGHDEKLHLPLEEGRPGGPGPFSLLSALT